MSTETADFDKGTRVAAEVVAEMAKVEQAMAHLDVNDRLNILAYCIAGYIAAEFEPHERTSIAKGIGKIITFEFLPVMISIQEHCGGAMGPAKGSA